MNTITVLFFANYRELAGTRKTFFEINENARVLDLKMQLIEYFPALEPFLGSSLISINKEFAFNDDQIPEAAEVAIFPPVSGGTAKKNPTIISVTRNEIQLGAILSLITLPSTGAACFFTGMVRGITTRGVVYETMYLEYESYQAMAEKKIQQVVDEIRGRWPAIEGIAIVQRIGRLEVGQPTVIIACSAAHRDTGVFEAAKYGIDRLKEIVPVWKKETRSEGEMWIEGSYYPQRDE